MKALILAAGLGTRLRPHSNVTPKPLFPIQGRPILDWHICNLISAGADALIINTHHLSHIIDAFLNEQSYPIPVSTRYEPILLGTGGAIKNVADFWDDAPFLVINSDIFTDIDLKGVYAFHGTHTEDITLVMHDYPDFNQVAVNTDDRITAFRLPPGTSPADSHKCLAFTGIHVLSPAILASIPGSGFVDIIDVYQNHLHKGLGIKAYVPQHHQWRDIGTSQSYRQTVIDQLVPLAFQAAGCTDCDSGYVTEKLKGDGSDRVWYRIRQDDHAIIMADHGLRDRAVATETDAFIAIGTHLRAVGTPVPEIYQAEPFCGIVCMEDLGNVHLQSKIKQCQSLDTIAAWYRTAIDILIEMSTQGVINFDASWTCQTRRYDRDLIINNECRYFVEAFLNAYLGFSGDPADLHSEFDFLAGRIEAFACEGFMHRDFQSRNIMVKNGRLHVIDFQGGRIGPMQYDLASLLIDPYVDLPMGLRDELQEYCAARTFEKTGFATHKYNEGYRYCRLARNLQMLGAFGFLSRSKNKTYFEQYIPIAVRNLRQTIRAFEADAFPRLTARIEAIL